MNGLQHSKPSVYSLLSLYKEEIQAEWIDIDVQGMFSYGKYLLIFTLNIVDGDERCVHVMADMGVVKLMEWREGAI